MELAFHIDAGEYLRRKYTPHLERVAGDTAECIAGMEMRKRLIELFIAVLFFSSLQGFSQERPKPNRQDGISEEVFAPGQKEVATGDVECGIDGKDQHESSEVLASPDNRWLAFAGVTAKEVKSKSFGERCFNRSRLWLWHTGDWRTGFSVDPAVDALGNGMRLRGWSADSRFVAFDKYTWQRNTDGDVQHSVVIIEPSTGIRAEIDSSNFEARPRCAVLLHPVGFTTESKLLLRVIYQPHLDPGEAFEGEAQEGEDVVKRSDACTEQSEHWLVNFDSSRPERIAEEPPNAQFHGKSRGKMNRLWWISSHVPKELLLFLSQQR